MADISITAGNVLASTTADIERRFKYGATITAGQAVFLDDSLLWQLYDSNLGTGYEATRRRGVALVGGASGQPGVVVMKDADFTPGGTLTNGGAVFASTTAGGITHDVPASGAFPVVLGIAKSASKMNLNPTASGAVM